MSRASDCHEMKVNNEDIKDFFVKHFKGNLYSKKLPLTSSSNLLLNSLQNENLNSYRTFSLSFEKVEHFFSILVLHSVSFAQILSSWIHAGMAESDKADREIVLAWHKK